MATTTPPIGGERAAGMPVQPPSQFPPPQGGDQSRKPRWYRRGWVIGLIAAVLGIGLGAAAGGSTKTRTTSVTVPPQTVTTTVAGGTRTVVRKIAGPTKTVTVPGPTKTITQTQTVTAQSASTSSGSQSSGALSWSGNGIQNIGTIDIPVDSVIKWTNDGQTFSIYDNENAVEVSSSASSGQSQIAAGTYHGFSVNADGNWTINIVPQ